MGHGETRRVKSWGGGGNDGWGATAPGSDRLREGVGKGRSPKRAAAAWRLQIGGGGCRWGVSLGAPRGAPDGCCTIPSPASSQQDVPEICGFSPQPGLELNVGGWKKEKVQSPPSRPPPTPSCRWGLTEKPGRRPRGGGAASEKRESWGAKPNPWGAAEPGQLPLPIMLSFWGPPRAGLGTLRAEVVPVVWVPPQDPPCSPRQCCVPNVTCPRFPRLPARAVSTGPDRSQTSGIPFLQWERLGDGPSMGRTCHWLCWWWQWENLAPGRRQNS